MKTSAPSEPLQWDDLSVPGVLRAADDIGIYVITPEDAGTYRVGYFPGPGPVVEWASGLSTLDDAKREAEACRRHNREVYKKEGWL